MKISKNRLHQFLKEYTTSDKQTYRKNTPAENRPAGVTGKNKRKAVIEITQNKIFEKLLNGKPVSRK